MGQENKWAWNQFGKLCTCQDLDDYLINREYRHGHYFHYTKLNVADSILQNRKFWLSNVSGFNDTKDTEQFMSKTSETVEELVPYFSLCFSTGVHENLPLWYLYAGLDGRGARIGLTQAGIKKLIKNGRYSLGLFESDEEGNEKIIDEIMNLENGKTMNLFFRDVIYAQPGEGEGCCALKYNTMTNYRIPNQEFERYNKEHKGFQKGLIWYYEKETRLIIQLVGDAEKEWEKWKEKIKSKEKNIRIILSFDESLLKNIRVTLAPNIDPTEFYNILTKKEGLQKLFRKTSVVQPSEYAGTINMRLCNHCEYKKNKEKNKETAHV